jgi:hypothetical protein
LYHELPVATKYARTTSVVVVAVAVAVTVAVAVAVAVAVQSVAGVARRMASGVAAELVPQPHGARRNRLADALQIISSFGGARAVSSSSSRSSSSSGDGLGHASSQSVTAMGTSSAAGNPGRWLCCNVPVVVVDIIAVVIVVFVASAMAIVVAAAVAVMVVAMESVKRYGTPP